jgi:iron complex transport system substrate-binding protein
MSRVLKLVVVISFLLVSGITAVTLTLIQGSNSSIFRINPVRTTASAKSASYVVNMSPMGDVRFEHVPQRVVTADANYNDMLVTLGQDGKLLATGSKNNFFDGFYAQLPGLKTHADPQRLTYLYGTTSLFDKELLYSLHAEVHHLDPLQLARSRGWSRADVEEIARNVGPFFANRYSRENSYPGPEPYKYYTVWELSDKVAQVYQRPQCIARLKQVYDKLVNDLAARLPAVEKRPQVGLVVYNNGKFLPFSLSGGGFGQAQYREVGARDAFASIRATAYADAGRGTSIDLEGLLALNPDILIVPWAIYPASRVGFNEMLKLKNNPLAQRISAFHAGHVYPGGTPLQGPIFYLFQIEMAAKQIYPDIFGPYRDDQHYPPNEQLFDRARVADILNGKPEGGS